MTFGSRLAQVRPVAVLTLAAIGLTGCSLLGPKPSGSTPTPTTGTSMKASEVKVGDCLNDAATGNEVTTVLAVPCTQAHDSEAYASIMVADGQFPGDKAIIKQAIADCTTRFDSFVGINLKSSRLNFVYYYPTASSWDNKGDRQILCLVIDPAGKTAGSLRGAAR